MFRASERFNKGNQARKTFGSFAVCRQMMKKTPRTQVVLLIIISLLVGYYFGVTKVSFDWKNYKPVISSVSKEPPPAVTTVDFSSFWNTWQKLQASYYDKSKLDPQKMLNGAISGMIQSLGDPFTVYLPPTQNDNFKKGLAGKFSGIGAELGIKNDRDIIVIAPLDGSPAQKSGIKTQDQILKVDGESTSGWTLSQAVEKIRGPKDTFVILTVLHKNDKNPIDIKIKRDVITVKSVTGLVKNVKCSQKCEVVEKPCLDCQKVAYIRLSQFGDNTNSDWLNLVKDIKSKGGFKGIVLDLRNNPGGYLTDAVFIAGEFLNPGQAVVVEDTGTYERKTLTVSRNGLFRNTPVVVLINKGSASASEIVAGALQDNKRAKLIGETSFGKGTIQEASDLGSGAGLHITIAKWLTPNGTWINGVGLTPDVNVALDSKDQARDTQLEKAIEELIK